MKKILEKKITFTINMKSLMVVVILAALAIATVGVTSTQIQATLSPDIRIRYNGVIQDLKDTNGNVVHPILYQGMTYLPLRATSDMLGIPVHWEGSTRTVSIGTTDAGPRRLGENMTWTSNSGIGIRWSTVQGAASLPKPIDDFGNEQSGVYTHALKSTGVSTSSGTGRGTFRLNTTATTLTFDFYCDVVEGVFGNNRNMVLTITNMDTGAVLYENRFEVQKLYRDIVVEIRGASNIGVAVTLDSITSGVRTSTDAYLLNPMIR